MPDYDRISRLSETEIFFPSKTYIDETDDFLIKLNGYKNLLVEIIASSQGLPTAISSISGGNTSINSITNAIDGIPTTSAGVSISSTPASANAVLLIDFGTIDSRKIAVKGIVANATVPYPILIEAGTDGTTFQL